MEEDSAIKKKESFDDCVILAKDSFDPDAVFLDDIVEDGVLPYLSLKVDGLNSRFDARKGRLELRPEDVSANDDIQPDKNLPRVDLTAVGLEIYGWESSWLAKIRKYLGF